MEGEGGEWSDGKGGREGSDVGGEEGGGCPSAACARHSLVWVIAPVGTCHSSVGDLWHPWVRWSSLSLGVVVYGHWVIICGCWVMFVMARRGC